MPRLLVTLFLALALCATAARADRAAEIAAFRQALDLVAAQDWDGATAAARGAGPAAAEVVEWHRLRAAQGLLGDYEAFLARRTDFPGLPLLKEKGEVAVARSTDPARVLAYFSADRPRTGAGAVALVRALQATGRGAEAEDEAMRAWALLKFTAEDEAAMIDLAGPVLTTVHELRLDRALWNGERVAEAERMLPRVSDGWRKLAEARLGLRATATGANALISDVPQALASDPGLAFERFLWRMRKDLYDDAMDLILAQSTGAAALGDPSAWAERRAILARWLMRNGRAAEAYRVAASHFLTEGDDYADLEFLSGFLALRKLGDPDTARRHFGNLKGAVATPISLARADYWTGRALETAGDKAGAKAAYQAAARHQTAYYGLLAAERLGLDLDPALLSDKRPPGDWRQEGFAKSPVLDAAIRLAEAGDRTLSKRFFLHLAESLDERELALLAETAFDIDEPHIAVLIGKAAAERGLILPRPYYPVPDILPAGDLPVSKALVLAIARRESEFDPGAESPAGARGLMQLMPATAEKMAADLGLPYELGRLKSDPAYNLTLGAAYLGEMVAQFGPAIPLIASGYNAGPRRPAQWMSGFGDPRTDAVDVVDWVETIPFYETRTYVMRVTEGVVIYRAKLKGQAGPVRITAELKG